MDKPTRDEALDYLAAAVVYEWAVRDGYGGGTRWWCTRADLKASAREEAERRVRAWADDEARVKREMDAPLVPVASASESLP